MKNEAKATETGAAKQPRPVCEIPDCGSPARYRGTCSPEHYQERALRRQAALRGVPHDEPQQDREVEAPVVTLVCVMDGCSKPARPSCSVEHNAASAYQGGAR